jgi:phosphatidate cytidylyltransferase
VSEPTRALPDEAAAGGEPIHPLPPDPAPERRGKRSDLPARLLSAAVLVPTVVYVVVLGGLPYLAVVIALILLGQREIYGLIEDKGAHPLIGFGLAAGAALPVVMYLGTESHATLLMTATLLAVMVLQLGKAQITEALASMSGTFFGVFYVGWLLAHAVVLRNIHDQVVSRWGEGVAIELGLAPQAGVFFMLFTLAVVVLTDAGAYFAGHAYGKRKLAPRISPGKTVEGGIGGLLAGVLGGAVMKGIFELFWPTLAAGLPWLILPAFAVCVSIAATVGDLIESLLKRDAKRKDAGALLPGMGGVLDRIDSGLLGIPIMYYLFLAYVFVFVRGLS